MAGTKYVRLTKAYGDLSKGAPFIFRRKQDHIYDVVAYPLNPNMEDTIPHDALEPVTAADFKRLVARKEIAPYKKSEYPKYAQFKAPHSGILKGEILEVKEILSNGDVTVECGMDEYEDVPMKVVELLSQRQVDEIEKKRKKPPVRANHPANRSKRGTEPPNAKKSRSVTTPKRTKPMYSVEELEEMLYSFAQTHYDGEAQGNLSSVFDDFIAPLFEEAMSELEASEAAYSKFEEWYDEMATRAEEKLRLKIREEIQAEQTRFLKLVGHLNENDRSFLRNYYAKKIREGNEEADSDEETDSE